ncbi:MAG: hypothetical protein N3E51_01750 [Candidatus Micrarchaeota archaeon]|nr:hypothetical protein [Candidatus Micrarchaeota archaeon]
MEFKSFISGMLFLTGLQMLLPFVGVKIEVVLPYAPFSQIVLAFVAILLSYYLFKTN